MDGFLIVLASTTDIANPRREVWDGDQLTAQPGEIRDMTQRQNTSVTFHAGNGWGMIRCFAHKILLCGKHFGMVQHIPHGRRPIDQYRLADHILFGQHAPIL